MEQARMGDRLAMLRSLVAQPMPQTDLEPGLIADNLFIGSKRHAVDVDHLVSLGITGVLNCAPGGIHMVPCDAYKSRGIRYEFTHVRRDDNAYPILHDKSGACSEHLGVAKAFYDEVQQQGGKGLFFCVAGQNRSATLGIAVLLLHGQSLERVLGRCSASRPFVLENVGFQQQLVELEGMLGGAGHPLAAAAAKPEPRQCPLPSPSSSSESSSSCKRARFGRKRKHPAPDGIQEVMAELLVPGLCNVFDVEVPAMATIPEVKRLLIRRVDEHLLSQTARRVGKAWLLYYGGTESRHTLDMPLDLALEEEAVEQGLQLAQLQNAFGLEVRMDAAGGEATVGWKPWSRFELIIFSTIQGSLSPEDSSLAEAHKPFTFMHRERLGALGTLLVNNCINTHLRAWDFGSGASFLSRHPLVFSFCTNPRNKRDFMDVATTDCDQCLDFRTPSDSGQGALLGMGANAIVHRAGLAASLPCRGTPDLGDIQRRRALFLRRSLSVSDIGTAESWDAAVKRPFSLPKMLAFVQKKSESGIAKRLRMAGALNRHGRLLYFYGLGVALASNCERREEYKFEVVLLSRYQEEFSTYTLKRFLEDYTADISQYDASNSRLAVIKTLQEEFSLIKVKVLLVSLLNAFRDLTLMGIRAFDFNHLDNVLISRDYKKARLIDIDGESKGSIQFPSDYTSGHELHQPALDVDLSILLPVVVSRLICGKGRGPNFAAQRVREIKAAQLDEDAKALIRGIVRESFFAQVPETLLEPCAPAGRHLLRVVEWFHAMLLERKPWTTWTDDIYEAMRCIDHLPIL